MLTILTQPPISKSNYLFVEKGHPAVTRNLLLGLDTIDVNYVYNPLSSNKITRTVLVLSGVDTLNFALSLKRTHLIDKLYVGPNVVTCPNDHNSIIASPLIDLVITPSQWVSNLYTLHCPTLLNKIIAWPSGVDTNFWFSSNPKSYFLIYVKYYDTNNELFINCINFLRSLNINLKFINYGEYNHSSYKRLLSKASLLIGFTGGSESQGIFWAESWSCDVPTFVLSNDSKFICGKNVKVSSCPYLSSQTGAFFSDFSVFSSLINSFIQNHNYSPRDWVLNNLSATHSAKKILMSLDLYD